MDYERLNSEQVIPIPCLESSSRKTFRVSDYCFWGFNPIKSNPPLMSFTAPKAAGNPVSFLILSMDINDSLLFSLRINLYSTKL